MHIILGFLGTIVTLLVLLKRLDDAGIDIGWLNPLAWRRRRAWKNKYEGNPIFSLVSPLEIAALLATAAAKIDGDLSLEEKTVLLELFQTEFSQTQGKASDLLRSSLFLFGDGKETLAKPHKILANAIDSFSEEQARSLMSILEDIKNISPKNQDLKQAFVGQIEKAFDLHFNNSAVQ